MRKKLEQILFPATCVLTGEPADGIDLADDKIHSLNLAEGLCPTCAHRSLSGKVCGVCLKTPPIIERSQVGFMLDEGLKALLHPFKYGDNLYYSRLLAELWAHNLDLDGVEALVPVPLHVNRLSERGFNQSLELAKQLSKLTGIPVLNVVERVIDTPHQVGLDGKERRSNLKGAFQVSANLTELSCVAMIDDVMTTGTTFLEMAKVLQKASPELNIQAWALAKSEEG